MSRVKPTAATALRNALKQEKQRFDKAQDIHFNEQRQREQAALSAQRFPRTLENGTFFTPHLSSKARTTRLENGLVKEYMVVVPRPDTIVTAKPLYNPVRNRSTQLPTSLSLEVKGKVFGLEKAGYRFIGTNKDILVFEKQYNQKQRDRRWAWSAMTALVVSVTALTTAIFAGEYIYDH